MKISACDRKYGDNFGKWFVHYRRRIGTPDDCDFHSFRHTCTTLMDRAEVHRSHREELIGHESEDRRSDFKRYRKPALLTLLKAAVDRINTPIDIEALLAAEARSEALEPSSVWPRLDGETNADASLQARPARRKHQA
jgi:hypothetical protein